MPEMQARDSCALRDELDAKDFKHVESRVPDYVPASE